MKSRILVKNSVLESKVKAADELIFNDMDKFLFEESIAIYSELKQTVRILLNPLFFE